MTVTVHHADCMDILPTLESDSIDACVTDPPGGINFMQKKWDSDRGGRRQWIAWLTGVMEEVYRVLKPGGHAVVWSLPRTSHWTGTALEDAGFEVRDVVLHLFGQGFPKSRNISRAIDAEAGISGTFGDYRSSEHAIKRKPGNERHHAGYQRPWRDDPEAEQGTLREYIPATDAARKWQGYGTCLKPAAEFWWLVRKPISEATIALNVLRWGVGGLNIDACKIGSDVITTHSRGNNSAFPAYPTHKTMSDSGGKTPQNKISHDKRVGRWPSNVTHDGSDEVMKEFAKFGDTRSGHIPRSSNGNSMWHNASALTVEHSNSAFADSGTAARFFYTGKASPDDRMGTSHPTTKPTSLIRWLCKMITPPSGLILDPFGGSGVTAVAAMKESFDCIIIEKEAEHHRDILNRIAHVKGDDTPLFRAPSAAPGLFD